MGGRLRPTGNISPSLRANGSRECAPDDRLREAIHAATKQEWIASSLTLLAMTAVRQKKYGSDDMLDFGKALTIFAALHLTLPVTVAFAQAADTILFNGKILTVDKDFSVRQALAIGQGQVLASGTTAAMKKLAGDNARLIDLGGRTVIPGLTDGHIHGIRAALTFGTEVNWIGVSTLKEALERIRQAGKTQKPGSWIVVAGGWTEEQFEEKRRPTAIEVAAAAPDNPVYIQHLYDWLLLTTKAMEALNIRDDADVTPGGKLERDTDNKPTGVVIGNGNTLGRIFDKLPKPTLDQQVDSSA
jgi:predicted amidohydrolase YtcJ